MQENSTNTLTTSASTGMKNKPQHTSPHFLGTTQGAALIASLACILWGSAFPTIKVSFALLGVGTHDLALKVAFAGLRFTTAGVLLFVYMAIVRGNLIGKLQSKNPKKLAPIPKKIPWAILGLGVLQTTLQYSLFYVGLSRVSGVKSSVIGGLGTIILALLSHFYYKNDKLTTPRIVGIGMGFSAIVWINMGKGFSWDFAWNGEGLLLLTTCSSAVATIMAKELGKTYPPIYITALQMTFGGVLLLLLGGSDLVELLQLFTVKTYLLLGYSVLISAVGFALWFTLLQYQKAGDMAVYRLIIPVSGASLSAMFLPSESFTWQIALGLLAVVMGILFSRANFKPPVESNLN